MPFAVVKIGFCNVAVAKVGTGECRHRLFLGKPAVPFFDDGRTCLNVFCNLAVFGHGLDIVLRNPALNRRSAPRRVDNAHRHTKFCIEFFCKIVARCAKLGGVLWRSCLPLAASLIFLFKTGVALNHKDADVVVGAVRDVFRTVHNGAVRETAHRHFHIALSRCEPYLANHYIVDVDSVLAVDNECVRATE